MAFEATPQISVEQSMVTINVGRSSVCAHVDDLSSLAKLLEGFGQMLSVTGGAINFSPSTTAHVPVAVVTASTEAPAKSEEPGAKKSRKSRKNVGNALVIWMRAHPGWHSEEDLLKTVIAHRMSDASPQRALKIALGRRKDDVFATDGLGKWRLMEDMPSQAQEPISYLKASESSEAASSRWGGSNAQEIARARRNLLGM